jgi:hypothetical protein
VSVDVLIEGQFDVCGAAAEVAYEVRSRSCGNAMFPVIRSTKLTQGKCLVLDAQLDEAA